MFDRQRRLKPKPPSRALRRRAARLAIEVLERRDVLSPIITTTTLPSWTVNQPGYLQSIKSTGAVDAVTFSETGTLPPGMTMAGPTFTTVDDPTAAMDPHGDTFAYGISGNSIVGSYLVGVKSHGFLYDGTAFQTLDDPSALSNGPGTFAEGVSGTTVVGYYFDTKAHGFRYDGSTYQTLDDPSATGDTYVYGVSGSNVVGVYGDSAGSHGFLYNGSTFTTLDDPDAAAGKTFAQGVSGSTVVGYYQDSSGGHHGFVYDGTFHTLDAPAAAPGMTYAQGISGSDVVGQFVDGSSGEHGFFYDGSTYTTIDVPGATGPSDAYGISGSTIVGTYQVGALVHGFTYNMMLPTLSGTPTTAGTYNFSVTESDGMGTSPSQAYTVTINPAVAITTTALPAWTAGRAGYSQSLAATGGTGTRTFSSSGTLPTGLTLSSTGVLSGTPTTAGNYSFTVTATDTVGGTGSQGYTVTVNPAITVTTTSLATWTANLSGYSQTITATGGTGALTFSSSAGLPAGLTLSSSGVLSGTPTASGSFSFTIIATDSVTASGNKSLSLTINPAVAITTTSVANGTQGVAYSQTINATGGTGTLSFNTTAGTLPTGLTLSSTGVLSGTPTATGTFSFTISATDTLGASSSQGYSATINPPTVVTVSPSSLPNGDVGAAYSQPITATGGTSPYSFAVTSGTLPTGLTLSTGGVLSGTPTATGSFSFTVTATDASSHTGTQHYTIAINPAVAISTTTLANWTVSQPGYGQTILASGGMGTFSFSATGTLPTGLTLSTGGVLSGTPTAQGSFSFTVTAGDSLGGSASQSYTVVINPAVAITTTALPGGSTGTAYSQTIAASGGTGSKTFAASAGTLPTSLTLSSTGVLFGTPTATGSFTFTITATDTVGASASQAYTVTITSSTPTQLSLSAPLTATAGTSFNVTITAEDASNHTTTGFNGTVTLSSSAGADIAPTSVMLSGGTATIPVTLTAAGTQTLTASFSGLTPGTASVTVSPGTLQQYLVSIPGSGTVQAGTGFLVVVQAADSFGNPITSYTGPGSVTASVTPVSAASNFPTSVSINSTGLGLFLGNLQKVGSYTVSVASGSLSGSAGPVTVKPAAAAKLGFATQPVSTPTGLTLPTVTVQVQDLFGNLITTDNSDTITLNVASGPGSFASGSITSALVTGGVATFNNLTLIKPGNYMLGAKVAGLYTGPNSTAFTVKPLQVLSGSFLGTPSGFSLQFNTAFLINSTTPVLYGQGFQSTAPVPSVTLTETKDALGNPVNVPITGSLIVNAATNTITFLTTDTSLQVNNSSPILPDGTYTAVLTSSAATDGFQAFNSGGGFLDGKGTGTAGSGNFTATFTVSAKAANDDVLWVPPTADGPGQTLNGPGDNQLGIGYPVYLNDITGTVTSAQVTINYDPTLLNVTGAASNGFLPGSTFTLNTALSTPGHAVVQYSDSGANSTKLTGGQVALGYLTATVPSGTTPNPMPYRAKDLLHLSGPSINGGIIHVVTSDGLHVVAFAGDADGNGAYSSSDAVLITRVGLQTDVGFAAYSLIDPVVVADTDGAGFIPADAALQANEAGVGFATANLAIPPVPAGVHFTPIANNVDPTLSVDRGPWTVDRSSVTVAVNLDDPHPQGSTGLIAGHLALTYDPGVFSVSAADIHLGSVLSAADGWSLTPTIDAATGQIAIALSSDTPITSTRGGSLVTIDFHPRSGEPAAFATEGGIIKLASSAEPNGQYLTTELEDAQGAFTLTFSSTTSVLTPPGSGLNRAVMQPPTNPGGAEENLSDIIAHLPVDRTAVPVEVDATMPPTAVSEASAADLATGPTAAAPTEPLDAVTVHGAAIVAPVNSQAPSVSGSVTAAPLTVVFPVVGMSLASPPGSGTAGWQHLAEPLFQALNHTNTDPALVASLQALGRALTGSLFLAPSPSDNLDGLNTDLASPDLDGQGIGPWTQNGAASPRESTPSQTPPTPGPASDAAALDQVFAQAADDADWMLEGD
jgi:Putative Ig domain/Cohesin domain